MAWQETDNEIKSIEMRINEMRELIACCGLDCEKCEARKATLMNDDKLREKVAQDWSALNHVLITTEMIHCMGCRADGVKTPFCAGMCEIRKCALNKGFATCGDCQQLECCKTLGMVVGNNKDALENLRKGE